MSVFGCYSILISPFLPPLDGMDALLPLHWRFYTTFPFFISTIKLAVRGETMASCRSSAWAFLRGEKKCIDYRSIERGLAVVFAFSFSDANGERGGGEREEERRERKKRE